MYAILKKVHMIHKITTTSPYERLSRCRLFAVIDHSLRKRMHIVGTFHGNCIKTNLYTLCKKHNE